jgi:hypothetical protein
MFYRLLRGLMMAVTVKAETAMTIVKIAKITLAFVFIVGVTKFLDCYPPSF